MTPMELLGHTSFPPLGEQPYPLTVGANALYWFALERPLELPPRAKRRRSASSQRAPLPAIAILRTWEEVVLGEARNELELILPTYLQGQRWFGGKAHRILSTRLIDAVAVPYRAGRGYLTLVRVDYMEADSELYSLPLTCAPAARAERLPGPGACRLPASGGAWSRRRRHSVRRVLRSRVLRGAREDEGTPTEGNRGRGRRSIHGGIPEDGAFVEGRGKLFDLLR